MPADLSRANVINLCIESYFARLNGWNLNWKCLRERYLKKIQVNAQEKDFV